MDIKATYRYILELIFPVVFNLLFFLVGGIHHPASVWCCYAFIHLAYAQLLMTPLLIHAGKNAAVFGFSLYSVSAVYFCAEFVVGMSLMFLVRSFRICLVVQIILAAVYGIFFVANLLTNEHTNAATQRQEMEISYVKSAAARIRLLMESLADPAANKEIEKAYDILHASPTKTVPAAYAVETEIMKKISQLESAVGENAPEKAAVCAKAIVALTEERNQKVSNTGL